MKNKINEKNLLEIGFKANKNYLNVMDYTISIYEKIQAELVDLEWYFSIGIREDFEEGFLYADLQFVSIKEIKNFIYHFKNS